MRPAPRPPSPFPPRPERVERMRAPKSADVLARMDPAKAKQVTAELARRTELLRAADNG
jgi:hypothetical protein